MKKIVIDPGHGGSERANRGPTGYVEADGVLDISLKLRKLLVDAGYTVMMTREKDETVELYKRPEKANLWKGELLISVHSNAAADQNAGGVETFHTLVNEWNNQTHYREAKRVAEIVQNKLVSATGLRNRGIKTRLINNAASPINGKDFYAVIRRANMAALIVEVAFHSNPKEEALLKTDDFRTKAAVAMFNAIKEAYPITSAAPQPTPSEGLYRVRKSWEDSKSQVGAYKGLENAKAECDKHSGYGVFDDKGNKVYPLPSPTPDIPKVEEKEQGTLIMDKTQATAAQLASYALKGNPTPLLPNCTVQELAQIFIEEGEVEGVRGDVAWAQALKETGYFKYGGIVLPEQNNYSGIGALNNNSQGDAAIFETPRIGVRAQIQHLKAYASTEALKLKCVDPRFHLVKRGSAKYVEWLGFGDNPNGAGWAWPGNGYGYDIIKIMDSILQEPKATEETPIDSDVPQWQRDAFKKLVERKVIKTPEAWENRLGETITIGEVMGIMANMM